MEYTEAVIIAIIVGLVEVMKQSGLPKKASPLVAIGLGIAGGMIYLFPGDPRAGVFMGLVMGLSASGLYSGSKSIFKDTMKKYKVEVKEEENKEENIHE